MVIPFSCPQSRGILSQLSKWPHDQYLKENEQHVQGKLNSPFSDLFLLDSTENLYLGRISESFAVGKYLCGPNGVWSSENGGYNSGRKAWVQWWMGAGAGCLPQPWWPCALTQPRALSKPNQPQELYFQRWQRCRLWPYRDCCADFTEVKGKEGEVTLCASIDLTERAVSSRGHAHPASLWHL